MGIRRIAGLIFVFCKLAWRGIQFLAKVVWIIMSYSVAALYVGVKKAHENMAEDLQKAVNDFGIPTEQAPAIHTFCAWGAVPIMVVVWIIAAELTVLALRLIF